MQPAIEHQRVTVASSVGALLRAFAREPILLFWSVFVAAIPIYVGQSGMPQPGNLLILLVVPLALARWNGRLERTSVRTFVALLLFTAWVCIVNFGWSAITGKFSPQDYVLFPVYYAFNAAVVLAALLLHRRLGDVFVRATTYSVFFAVAYQVLASFFYRSSMYRDALFFNNPNQLGYWALLSACLISLTQKRLKLGILASGIAITGCAYLAILSASRAAVLGVAILLILLVFSNPRLIIGGILATVAFVNIGGPLSGALDSTKRRAELQDQRAAGGFVEERGYDRLWDYKEHLLLGAGEGDLQRFTEEDERPHEIHSSAATVLFSYGVIGAYLFLLFVWRAISGAPVRASMILIPILAYTVAHQGLRFTMLWVLLAVFIVLKTPPRTAKARGTSVSPRA